MDSLGTQLGGDYPRKWDDFIGQDLAKAKLLTAAQSAKMRGDRMAHTLLAAGTPGIGKTSLAVLTAVEVGAHLKVISGAVKAVDARMALAELEDGDVLFIDEIHQVFSGPKTSGEWLLHLLQDGVIMGPRGAEPQPDVTVLAATTDAGRMPATVIERFAVINLVSYTDAEAATIARVLAGRVMEVCPAPSPANCVAIARAASNSPRMMTRLWETTRDICMAAHAENWTETEYDLTKTLAWHGLTADGLTLGCRSYLGALQEFGGTAGLSVLKDRLQEPGGLGGTERLLQDKRLITISKQGRTLTSLGMRRALQLKREEEAKAA